MVSPSGTVPTAAAMNAIVQALPNNSDLNTLTNVDLPGDLDFCGNQTRNSNQTIYFGTADCAIPVGTPVAILFIDTRYVGNLTLKGAASVDIG